MDTLKTVTQMRKQDIISGIVFIVAVAALAKPPARARSDAWDIRLHVAGHLDQALRENRIDLVTYERLLAQLYGLDY